MLKIEKKQSRCNKRNIREIITIRNVLNHLINSVEELENVTVNK